MGRTDADGDSIWGIPLHPIAVVVAKRCLRVMTCQVGGFTDDLHFRRLATDKRVLDDRVRSCLTDISELLALLEDLFAGSDIDSEGDEYDEPRVYQPLRHCEWMVSLP